MNEFCMRCGHDTYQIFQKGTLNQPLSIDLTWRHCAKCFTSWPKQSFTKREIEPGFRWSDPAFERFKANLTKGN